MALFNKKNDLQAQKPRDRPTPMGRAQGDAAISIIGSGMQVVGDISTEGTVRVEGQVRGTLRAGTAVILAKAGAIEGNILTQDAVIGGNVNGSIVASNRLELQSTCTVEGEIRTRAEHLKLEEGARFAGQVHMIEEERVEPAAPLSQDELYGESSSSEFEMYSGNQAVEAEAPGEEREAEEDAEPRKKAEAR